MEVPKGRSMGTTIYMMVPRLLRVLTYMSVPSIHTLMVLTYMSVPSIHTLMVLTALSAPSMSVFG
jgi:hypothetical protein